jgi:hypothetical protein
MNLRIKKLLSPALPVVAAINAAEEPILKEGLWSIHSVTTGNPGNKRTERTRSICRDHAYDVESRAKAKAMMAKTCKTNNLTGAGSKYLSESECVQAGSTMRSKGTRTFNGDTSVHSEETTTFTPPMDGVAEATIVIDQKYIGACPAGMQPGDSMDADGNVVHKRR